MTLTFRRRRHAVKLPHYRIQNIQALGTNPDLVHFLKELGIWEKAQGKLSEVYYYTEDEKKRRKHFFALGHQNETGGWQIFAKNFTGCIGRSGLTILNPGRSHADIFKDFREYLESDTSGTAIIVNNMPLLPQATAKAKDYCTVNFSTTLLPFIKNQ